MAFKQARLLAWHRRIGLSVLLITCAFAISGLSRTITKTVHPPQGVHGPQAALTLAQKQVVSTGQALAAAGLSDTPIAAFRLRDVDGKPTFQILAAAPPRGPAAPNIGGLGIDPHTRWVDAQTGSYLTDGDQQAALAIARRELQQPVIQERLDAFDAEYGFINRLLPVWRIHDADNPHQRITVSTVAGDISSRHSPLSRVDRWLFSYTHKFFFIANREVREGMAILFCLGILTLGLSGMWLSWRVWRRGALAHLRPMARRAHVWLGLSFGGFAAVGAASGILHTVMVYVAERPPQPEPAVHLGIPPDIALPVSALQTVANQSPIVEVDLRQLDQSWAWRARHTDGQAHWLSPDGATIPDGEIRAVKALGKRVWGSDVTLLTLRQHFDADYPFINRFLPVWEAEPKDAPGTTLFLSSDLGNLTRKLDPWDRAQARSFSLLHSWKWLPEIVRVPLLIISSAGIVIMTLSGLWLWRPRRALSTQSTQDPP